MRLIPIPSRVNGSASERSGTSSDRSRNGSDSYRLAWPRSRAFAAKRGDGRMVAGTGKGGRGPLNPLADPRQRRGLQITAYVWRSAARSRGPVALVTRIRLSVHGSSQRANPGSVLVAPW